MEILTNRWSDVMTDRVHHSRSIFVHTKDLRNPSPDRQVQRGTIKDRLARTEMIRRRFDILISQPSVPLDSIVRMVIEYMTTGDQSPNTLQEFYKLPISCIPTPHAMRIGCTLEREIGIVTIEEFLAAEKHRLMAVPFFGEALYAEIRNYISSVANKINSSNKPSNLD